MTEWTGLAPADRDVPNLLVRSAPHFRNVRTARQRVQDCLDRIDEHEERVRAWVLIDREGALEAADRVDRRPGTAEAHPLRGAVIGVKDIVDVAGMPTGHGVSWPDEQVAWADAPIVARLRAAGAIILGKTVTTPYAWVDPPPTRNPWDASRTPGGSSSGSAAAVAVGMCEAAIGTQTGGSIIRPASFCGIYGFKPSYGVLPTEGIGELARSLDHPGFLARSVFDLMLLFRGAAAIGHLSLSAAMPRIARARGPLEERASAEMRAALDAAMAKWVAAGATIEDLELSAELHRVHDWHYQVMAAEAAHARGDSSSPEDLECLPEKLRALVADGHRVAAPHYLTALAVCEQRRRSTWIQFDWFDVLVMPSAAGVAPDASTTGDPYFNAPWSYFGLPVLNLPIAGPPDCLPLGVQVIGPPGSDSRLSLFRHGMWCEAVLRGDPEPDFPLGVSPRRGVRWFEDGS